MDRCNINDISDELDMDCSEPHIARSDCIVRQTLSFHVRGGSWHSTTFDVCAKPLIVVKVVDRINGTMPNLPLMMECLAERDIPRNKQTT